MSRKDEISNLASYSTHHSSLVPTQNSKLKTQNFIFWLLIIVLAIAMRLVFWQIQARSGAVQPGDPEEYYRAALHILQGGYHDTGKWLRPPLYPGFLTLIFTITGVDLARTMLTQAVLSGLAVPVFGMLAWQLFGRRDASLASGLLAAVFVPLASFGSVLFAEGLFVILITAALASLIRSCNSLCWRDAFVCGLLLGLATLTRAVALSFIPIAALLLVYQAWRRAGSGAWSGPGDSAVDGAELCGASAPDSG